MKDLIKIIQEDYNNFPENQTYTIYAYNVYFEDPLNKFRGIDRYQKMIKFLANFFSDIKIELHKIIREENIITTEWTLKMNSPLPWKPRLTIPGYSKLKINSEELIVEHCDYWNISPLKVLLQNFSS